MSIMVDLGSGVSWVGSTQIQKITPPPLAHQCQKKPSSPLHLPAIPILLRWPDIFLLQMFSSNFFSVNLLLWQTKLFTSSKIQNIKFKEDNAESAKFRQRQTKSAQGQFWACLVQSFDCLTDSACLGLRSLLRPEGSAWTILYQNLKT